LFKFQDELQECDAFTVALNSADVRERTLSRHSSTSTNRVSTPSSTHHAKPTVQSSQSADHTKPKTKTTDSPSTTDTPDIDKNPNTPNSLPFTANSSNSSSNVSNTVLIGIRIGRTAFFVENNYFYLKIKKLVFELNKKKTRIQWKINQLIDLITERDISRFGWLFFKKKDCLSVCS
jgi:hypothetical protein